MTEAEEQPSESQAAGEEDEDLVAEVAAHDEALAAEVAALTERAERLESELESTETRLAETEEKLEHTRADFQNYKKRAKRRQEEIKERATEELVERLLDVRDNLSRALEEESGDVESLREGVKLTRKQFDRVLDAENVERIDPEPGTEVDANRHEVMMRVDSEQPADTVATVYRPGYEMAGKVLRAAQVTVSDGSEAADDPDASTEDGEGEVAEDSDESDPAEGTVDTDAGDEATDESGAEES